MASRPCRFRVPVFPAEQRFEDGEFRRIRRDECRTFHVIALLGDPSPILDSPGDTPLLGADFLIENRMRIRADFGLLGPRPTAQRIELDSLNTSWASLYFPG